MWNFSKGWRGGGGRSPTPLPPPLVLITWRALGSSFLLFLLIHFWHQVLSPRTLLFMRPSPPPWKSICRYLFNVARFGAPMSINIWPGYLLIFNLRFLQNYIYTHISVYNFDGCQAWSQPGSFSLRIVRKSSIETPSNDVSRVSKVFLENFSMVSVYTRTYSHEIGLRERQIEIKRDLSRQRSAPTRSNLSAKDWKTRLLRARNLLCQSHPRTDRSTWKV